MKKAGHVAGMEEMRNKYKILTRKHEGKRPLGRPRRKWKESIEMDNTEKLCWGVDWIHLADDRDRWWALVNTVMNLRVS
jgi:hypothetical protein